MLGFYNLTSNFESHEKTELLIKQVLNFLQTPDLSGSVTSGHFVVGMAKLTWRGSFGGEAIAAEVDSAGRVGRGRRRSDALIEEEEPP